MRHDISFDSQGQRCVGWLYVPDEGPTNQKVPAIVLANALTAVKEMYLDAYATRFADAGFAALVFDFRHFGGSDGEPRGQLFPDEQLDDIRNAISWLSLRGEVDANRIGGWGMSLGAAHLMALAPFDRRLKVLVLVVPSALANIDVLEQRMGPEGTAGFLAYLAQDRTTRYQTGQPSSIKIVTDQPEPSFTPGPVAHEFFTNAQATIAPAWRNEISLESVEKLLAYDPTWPVHRLAPMPVRMIAGENDEFMPFNLVRATFERISEPKDLVVLPCGHIDVSNKEPFVTQAADRSVEWFQQYL